MISFSRRSIFSACFPLRRAIGAAIGRMKAQSSLPVVQHFVCMMESDFVNLETEYTL